MGDRRAARSGSREWPQQRASAKLAHWMRYPGIMTIFRWAGGAALALALAACASTGELGPRHLPSAGEIPLPAADFAAYVAGAQAAIAEANQAIH